MPSYLQEWTGLLRNLPKSVDHVVKNGDDINAKDPYGRTLLMAVCCHSAGPTLLPNGWSPAQYYERMLETAKNVIDNGADLNTVSADGHTPLTFSIQHKIKKLAKLIITSGANVCKRGAKKTPLAHAVNQCDTETINLLLSYGAELTLPEALFEAVQDKNTPIAIVQLLIKKGANVNFCYTDGYTPLTKSIHSLNPQAVQELVMNGADINQADSNGEIPLILAVERGNSEIVKYLIDKGADPNVTDKNEQTPLIKALFRQNFEWVKRLASKENVNRRTKEGQTPLSIALSNYDLPSFDYLIKLGADPKTEMETMEKMARDDSNLAGLLRDLKLSNPIKSCSFENATGHDGE